MANTITTTTVTYSGSFADYRIDKNDDGYWTVTPLAATDPNASMDILTAVETLQFSDKTYQIAESFTTSGAEFQVNTYTSTYQDRPSITSLADGGFVVTWMSENQDGSGWGTYGQRYAADGNASGAEFQINTYTSSSQHFPSVTSLADGGFVVTWMSEGQDGSGSGVYGQRYAADGNASGDEFLINTVTSNDQRYPSVTSLADGGFVVTWAQGDIYGQRYAANGTASGAEFLVNTVTSNTQDEPSVASLADGGFVVTWMSYNQDGSHYGIYGQRYAGNGMASGAEFRVNTVTLSEQSKPSVTSLADGGFVVTWMSDGQDGSGWGVYGQRYAADGNTSGAEFKVNTVTSSSQQFPSVTSLADGGFVVTWMSYNQDGSDYGIYGQRYAGNGTASGAEFKVNTYTSNDQRYPSVTSLADGGFVVTWMSYQDGSYGIYGQRFASGSSLIDGDTIVGSSQDDILLGTSSDNTLIGGVGDDNVDGGAGYNTYVVQGSADAYYWVVNSSGEVILTDTITDPADVNDGTDEGVDTLKNIQLIEYRLADGTLESNFQLDDYSNAPADSNFQIEYGEWVTGRANFYGDIDYFKLDTVSGQKVYLSGASGSSDGRLINSAFDSSSLYVWSESDYVYTANSTGTADIYFSSTQLSSSTPMASKGYGFIFRRVLEGTDNADTLTAGTDYEWLSGGVGDDTLVGSDRSDVLLGGSGNDTLTGGKGRDELDGGDGSGDTAVFSGKASEYTIEWLGGNLSLRITDNVKDRDGIDELKNIQVLQFTDKTIVLDEESNTPIQTGPDVVAIGETMSGSMPITKNYEWVDEDYFQQKFTSDITTDSALRLTVSGNADQYFSGDLYIQFRSIGATDSLTFKDLTNESNINEFSTNFSQGSERSWIISPQYWGSGSEFLSMSQRADIYVRGYARDSSGNIAVGDLADYTIKLDQVLYGTTGSDDLVGDGKSSYVELKEGDDKFVGSALNEEIVGGAGADTISGGEGDDLIRDSQGANTLDGGLGDDTFDLRGSGEGIYTLEGSIDGGDGFDTLKVSSGVDLSDLIIVGVEQLDGSGGNIEYSAGELNAFGFTHLKNVFIKLDGSLTEGGTLDLSGFAGKVNLQGTNQSDTLIGNDDDNIIRLLSDEDVGSGLGIDTVSAGGGNDTIRWDTKYYQSWNKFFSSVDDASQTYSITGDVDGGDGNDELILSFSGSYWYHSWGGETWNNDGSTDVFSVDLSKLSLSDVEVVSATGYDAYRSWAFPAEFIFSNAQLTDLTSLNGFKAISIVGGGTLDLTHLASLTSATWTIGDAEAYTIVGSSLADSIELASGTMTVSAGDGDDVITMRDRTLVTDTLDGGDGNDTLRIYGSAVDLSQANLSGIENISANSKSLALTEAQFASFSSTITGNAGLILKVDGSGIHYVDDLPAGFVGLQGDENANQFVGGDGNDILAGGAGGDTLTGGAGLDTLIAGQGVDTLSGGLGDDVLDVRGKAVVSDRLSGGAGTDTLLVEDGQNLTAATLTGIEVIKGSGTITLTASQLVDVRKLDGVSVQLSATGESFTAPENLTLSGGANIYLPDSDAEVVASGGYVGSTGDDKIVGTAGADKLYGGRGADELSGGAGNDTLVGGKGADTLLGGDGDDEFIYDGSLWENSNTVYSDIVDGGNGIDTLSLVNTNNAYDSRFVINPGSITNVEAIDLTGYGWRLSLDGSLFNSLDVISLDSLDTSPWSKGYLEIQGGSYLDIDLSNLSNDEWRSIYFSGNNGIIDASADPIIHNDGDNFSEEYSYKFGGWSPIDWDYHQTSLDAFIGSSSDDWLYVYSDKEFVADLGAEDDIVEVAQSGKLSVTIDGGAGDDTLRLTNGGLYDLTSSVLTSVENIYHEDSRLIVTETQFANWSFDGNGAIYTLGSDGVVQGSSANDSYSGDGVSGGFAGGKGDDYISNVKTAVYNFNLNEYDITRSGTTVTVQHARGDMSDGTDTLNNVLQLEFADTTPSNPYILDDAPNDTWLFISEDMEGNSGDYTQLINAAFDSRKSFTQDYGSDQDVFRTTFVPNSPLQIDASVASGNNIYFYFYDVETQQQIHFESLVYGDDWRPSYYSSTFDPAAKWLPVIWDGEKYSPYEGGEVVFQVDVRGDEIEDYVFTLKYLDDYAGSVQTLGVMDAQDGIIRGYVGDIGDQDWIRTELIAGTKYEFNLKGVSSDSGSLVDPLLKLYDDQGRLISQGLGVGDEVAGLDDSIVFRPTETGTYYLGVSDVAEVSKGSWTLTQESLDVIADNPSTTERIEWSAVERFSVQSEINALTDHDWFKVWLDKGITYNFELNGDTLADPALTLRSASGRLLKQDDNSGTGSDSALVYSAIDTGWYFLDAGASGNAGKGTYVLKGSRLADDYSDDIYTTGSANVGADEFARGIVSYLGDSDWFSVGLSANVTYVITLAGDISDQAQMDPLIDPLLIIHDETGLEIDRIDDSNGSLNAVAYFTPETSGKYFLEAKSSFKYDIGSYSLNVALAPPDDHGDAFDATATALTLGENFTVEVANNQIGIPGDKDVFSIEMTAGKVYLLEMSGMANHGGTLVDPYLRIFDDRGHVIDFNNNGGLGNDAKFYFAPKSTGTFYIEASSNNDKGLGTYTLNVSERNLPPDDVADDLSTDITLTPGDNFAGTLLTSNDQDWFAINLVKGENYVFRAKASASGSGSLDEPVLELRDANGQVLKSVAGSDMLTTQEPGIPYTPAASGKFYLVVKAANGQEDTGSYTLVTRAPDDHSNAQARATDVSLNEVVTGAIQYNDGEFGVRAYDSIGLATDFDEDWFAFNASADDVITVQVQIADGSALSRPLVEVVDSTGRTMAIGDGLETDNGLAAATFLAASSGKYYARVIDGAGATGEYTLSVVMGDASDEDASGPKSIAFVDDGSIIQSTAIGVIGLAGDQDTYSINLLDGHHYRIETAAIRDGSTAPLGTATLNMLWKPDGSGTQSNGALTKEWVDNGDGTHTLKLFVDKVVAADWVANGLEAFTANVAINQSILGDFQGASYSINAFGDVEEASDGASVALEAFFYPDNFDISGSEPIAELLFADPTGGAAADASSAVVNEVTFDERSIEATFQQGSPSAFEEGAFTAEGNGTLEITVAPVEATQTGKYQLRVIDLGTSTADDHANLVSDFTGDVLAINESGSGKIDENGDKDLFAVNLTTGNIYDFSVKSYFDGLGTLGKAALRLIDSDGHLVSSGQYDVDTGRTELSVSIFENGQYFVEVSAIDLPGNTGTYVLDTRDRGAVENTNDDYASDAGTSITVGPGEPITGEIEIAGDSDWAAVSLEAGKVYVFDVLADGDGAGGTLTDSTLRLLDSEGNELAFDDDTGAGLDSHIQYTAGASGTYFLDVGSNRDAVGSYTLRVRELYSGIADPLRAAQWYLDATHIDELDNQFTGAGVKVAVVDDGIDSSHPDLAENYSFRYALDTQFDSQDGTPKYPKLIGPTDDHGTAVAGIIGAVANNETGIQGAAYDVELVSTRVKWSWADMTQAINDQFNFDVSNNSWGAIAPFSDNFNNTNLTFAWIGLRNGVEDGRDGKGTVFVFSAGNSAGLGDNTNYHNFQNAREVIAVGALAQDNTAAGFSTPGANVLVATYGVDMLTTDRHQPGWGYNIATLGDYTTFGGTSAAAPLLSGIVAMMLEANPDLGYRDVQKILAYSSSHPDVQDWKVNGASDFNLGGLLFNDKSGFGVVDAYAAVQLAKSWTAQNTAINEVSASARKFGMTEAIPDGNGEVYTKTFEIDSSMSVEHVELGVDIRHERLGDLIIKLISPNGTVSTLMDRPTVNAERPFGLSGEDSGVPTHLLWDFSSVQFWGEDASGTWTIQIEDVRAEEKGTLQSLSLRIYGENNRGNDIYVFTDEGFQHQVGEVLEDETGTDTINAAPLRYDMYVDLTDGVIAANATGHAIADWTTIENAVTGAGDDRLVGNDADNTLVGNSGDDQFEGGLGNDVIEGGSGADVAVYADIKAHYTVAWNPSTETLTVTDVYSTDGDEGVDTLTGIERLIFADAEMSLGETVGNRAPEANTTFFDSPVLISKGMGVDFAIPEDAFSDADGDANTELVLSISDPAGGELPDWLTFDEETGQFTGVPPEDYQGQLKLLVTATDEFGESVSDELTLQFGDNQAPVIDAVKEISLNEDGDLAALSLSLPYDPEGTEVLITVDELPSFGTILDKTGTALAVGTTLTADELTELYFETAADRYGDAGYFRYTAADEDSVSVRSGVHVFVEPVNDAPRFATVSSQLTVNYPDQTVSALDIAKPTDPESSISVVTLIGLPEIGQVLLDGNTVSVNDVLTFDQLDRLEYSLNENVNGPVGAVTIQAVDEEGVATNWALNIVVQNADGQAVGTEGDDEIYGSVAIDILYGKGGDDYLVGNAGEDKLYGGLGDDTLIGGSDNDKLDGSAGNDYLDGGSGDDLLAGGPGNDTYIVDSANDLVKEIIGGGAGGDDLVVTSVSYTAPDNVESLTAADDVAINLTGNALDNNLLGNDENNELLGEEGRDVLLGLGGDDLLNGGLGVDRLVGGEGDDTYYVDSRSDRILELANQGVDTVYASSSYTLYSNLENLILQGEGDFSAGGNSLDNRLVGNSGNNVLAGGLGADILEGGLGNDTYVLSDDNDTIVDTGGIDTIRSVLDIDLVAGIENAELVGILNTNATGTGVDNILIGNLGNNTLDGKGGVDTLTGGMGGDSFVLSYNGDGLDADLITDFASGEDLLIIDLGSFGVDVEALGLSGSGLASETSFVARAGAQALDPDDHYIFDTAQGILKFDYDGSGAMASYDIARVYMDGASSSLTATDLYIVI